MSFSDKDLKKLGHLARIRIPDSEIPNLKTDLDNILTLVEKMNQVDTANTEPMAHPLDETQPLRTDEVTESNQHDDLMQIAPQSLSGLYVVPVFVETE